VEGAKTLSLLFLFSLISPLYADVTWVKERGHPYIIKGKLIQNNKNYCYGEINNNGVSQVTVCELKSQKCPTASDCLNMKNGLKVKEINQESEFSEKENVIYNIMNNGQGHAAHFKLNENELKDQQFYISVTSANENYEITNIFPAEYRYLRNGLEKDFTAIQSSGGCIGSNRLNIVSKDVTKCFDIKLDQVALIDEFFTMLRSFLRNKNSNAGMLLHQALKL
jgi:hypothetical protein